MMNYRTVDEFCDHARRVADELGVSDALAMIIDLVQFVIAHGSAQGRVIASRELDLLCLQLGEKITKCPPHKTEPSRSVFIATAVYSAGGHTRLMRALIDADPGSEKFVLLTNVSHNLVMDDVPAFFDAEKISICPSMSLEERVQWLQQQLFRLAPQRIYLLQHHYDAVAVAAVQPGFSDYLFYLHHCDHALALGVHLSHATHVDIHPNIFYWCREMEGIQKNVFWPLVADPNVAPKRDFLSGRRLKTCTSGGFEKFESPHLLEQIPYSISYAEVVPRIIKATDGVHLHIGRLSENMLKSIREGLDKCGIAQDRFAQIPYVPKLASALVEFGVDVYVTSFPIGGALASIEVMSAGLPIVAHSNYRTKLFMEQPLLYGEAMVWRRVGELENILSSLTKENLVRHSELSRNWFEKQYLPIYLKNAITATIAGNNIAPPPRPVHYQNALQCLLDEQAALSKATPRSSSSIRSKEDASIFARWGGRLELEVAKLLCSVGLTRAGTSLWNRANAQRR